MLADIMKTNRDRCVGGVVSVPKVHTDVGSLFILLFTVLTKLLGHLSQGPPSMMTWFDCGLFHFQIAFEVLNRNEII